MTQLLQSRRPTASRRQRTQGVSDVFLESDVLLGLVRIVWPDYPEPAGKTFRTYTTNYKKCAEYTPDDLKFENEVILSAFLSRLEANYDVVLSMMTAFVSQYIDTGTTAQNDVLLVKRLIELIRDDQSILATEQFAVDKDGTLIDKVGLVTVTEVYLPAFLLSVWKFIATERKDNSKGAATITTWRKQGRYVGIDGSTIKQKIVVGSDEIVSAKESNNEEVTETKNNDVEDAAPATATHGKDNNPKKRLIDMFEDALDEYKIAEFIDNDYTAVPLRMSLAVAVDSFVDAMRYHLRSFRREQDDIFKNVILFVNAVDAYVGFLSKRMFSGDGDGKFSKWLWNNTVADVEEARKYRLDIYNLYGLISGGGTLSVFGYTSPDKDHKAKYVAGPFSHEDQVINREYYNLFVISDEIKNYRFTMPKDRSLRSDSEIDKKFEILTPETIAQIKAFPSLFMNENTDYSGRTVSSQEAYYGFVTDLRIQKNGVIKVRFRCEATVNQQQINNIANLLDIFEGSGVVELNYTHWTIKNVDLIEELNEAGLLTKEDTTRGS